MGLGDQLAQRTIPGELYEALDRDRIRCVACGHRCPIPEGQPGVCKVRFNRGGKLYAPSGYVSGVACDPIEKKPFFHVWPGARAFSFGMLGCDLHCGYCQNWLTSQALRERRSSLDFVEITPKQLVGLAVSQRADCIVSTYNEPLITSEWAVAVFQEAKKAGLATGYVSNGNATPEVLRYLMGWLDLFKVDLKSFRDRRYRELGGRLQPVLDSIQAIHEMGFWLEVVTLLVPGFNDSREELVELTRFLAGVSPDIPWHVTAFHGDYKMESSRATTAHDLLAAAQVGQESGLRFVYAGNLPGVAGGLEDTHCPGCRTVLVKRRGFRIDLNRMAGSEQCPECGTRIPGVWMKP